MTNPNNRKRVEKMVREFENMPYSIGPKGTQVWTREFMKYANMTDLYLSDDHNSWVANVYRWSQLFAFYKQWFVILKPIELLGCSFSMYFNTRL